MSRPPTGPLRRTRTRRGLRGACVATVATVAAALLTAGSQAPGAPGAAPAARDDGTGVPGGSVPPDAPLPDVPSQGDGSYHVELPPLKDVAAVERAAASGAPAGRVAAEAGLPVTVSAAYQRAERSVGRTDPGCGLRWELLAAIGKVESGHAGGGAVDADGTTLTRITGPALDGDGFALILDSEGGAWDGDTVYDRAVGPMQFLPTTWKTWGADGNGDGVSDPDNVFDAALAAGHYLCAGDRDLGTADGLERAILSYNHSRDYLRLVLGWTEFYLRGVHTVPDGTAPVPASPGAGSGTPATGRVGEKDTGTGRAATDRPTPAPPRPVTLTPVDPTPTSAPTTPAPRPTPTPTRTPTATPSPTPTPTPDPEPTPSPEPTPTPTPTPTESPAPSPTLTPDPETEPEATTPSNTPSPSTG
ncbi:hypothetical protein AB0D49_03750 [Streptomyces sp. NPDC048290]|uniref:lytic transglycosylase domain-containing protein n=1 Tax=Streptomyces sp. NPDC048290 TaxID=3155811 RepID=UPI0034347588